MLISNIFIWWVFSLNIFSIGWLTKYIGTFIKKSKYFHSLPQRLSRYPNSNLHRHGKKKVCGKFLFFSGFSDMPWFLDLSLIIHEVVKENVISEKPLKKINFPHTFFYRTYEDSNRDMYTNVEVNCTHILIFYGILIYFFSQPILDMFKQNTHQMKIFEISIFLAFFTKNLVKLHLKFLAQCSID
jgi:hypothetical protein